MRKFCNRRYHKIAVALVLVILQLTFFGYSQAEAAEPTSYADLRARAGASGDRISISTNPIGGTFAFSTADPFGSGDDNGIVIRAPNGFWIREHQPSASNPTQLAWFELGDGANIGSLVLKLARRYSPHLYLRMPAGNRRFLLGYTQLTGITQNFGMFSGGGNTEIVQDPVGLTAGSDQSFTMIKLDDYKSIHIDSGITFIGRHDLFGGPQYGSANGALDMNLTGKVIPVSLELHCDFQDTPAFGVNHTGTGNGVGNAVIGGTYSNSGLRANSGIKSLHLDNLVVTDPLGLGAGYDPISKKADIKYFEKHHGAWLQNIDVLTGQLTLQYGSARWFMAQNGQIGDGPNAPFTIIDTKLGTLADGTQFSRPTGMRTQAGKADGLRYPYAANARYLRIISDGPNSLDYAFILEATPESTSANYYDNDLHVDFSNAAASRGILIGEIHDVDPAGPKGKGQVRNNVFTGSTSSVTVYDADNTFEDMSFGNFVILRNPKYVSNRPDRIRIVSSTVAAGGSITVSAGQEIRMKDLYFAGGARDIIKVSNASEIDPISIYVNNVMAAKGSLITAENSGNVALYVDDVRVAIPYEVPVDNRAANGPPAPKPGPPQDVTVE